MNAQTRRGPDPPVAVITGATSGFGLALAEALIDCGGRVLVTGRDAAAVQRVCAMFPADRLAGATFDVREIAGHRAAWDQAIAAFGRVDHWLNNAGIGGGDEALVDLEPQRILPIVETNLLGALIGARIALEAMRDQGHGQLWLTEGLGSDGFVLKGASIYGATKAGATYAYRVLAAECARGPVRVGFLSPGIMPTAVALGAGGAPSVRARRILNWIGDRPETVARWMAPRILAGPSNGAQLKWLTRRRLAVHLLVRTLSPGRIV